MDYWQSYKSIVLLIPRIINVEEKRDLRNTEILLRTHYLHAEVERMEQYMKQQNIMETKLARIEEISKEKPQEIFTSIYHYLNKDLLILCHKELDGKKATGLDGITKAESEELKKIIEAIYESKFSKYMYGFRPNKSCHDALKELS